jgi:hypothetical protein
MVSSSRQQSQLPWSVAYRILVLVVALFFFACRSSVDRQGGRSMLMESPLFEESNITITRPLGAIPYPKMGGEGGRGGGKREGEEKKEGGEERFLFQDSDRRTV